MAKGKTVDVIKKAKIDLEASIRDLTAKFESEHGVVVGWVNLKHERIKMTEQDEIDMAVGFHESKEGKIIDVEVDIRFPKE